MHGPLNVKMELRSYVVISLDIICVCVMTLSAPENAKRPVTEPLSSRRKYFEVSCCLTVALPARASNRFSFLTDYISNHTN